MKMKELVAAFEVMLEAYGREALITDVIEEGGLDGAIKIVGEQAVAEDEATCTEQELDEQPAEYDTISADTVDEKWIMNKAIEGIIATIKEKVELAVETGNPELITETKGLIEAIQIIKVNTCKGN